MIHELYIIQIDRNLHGNISYRNRLSNKLHRSGLNLKYENSFRENSNKLKFSDGHIVTWVSDSICCSHTCRLCSICQHSYWCNCYDYAIKSLICTHIHTVASSKIDKNIRSMVEK